MDKKMYDSNDILKIAKSIREKNKEDMTYKVSEMDTKILQLPRLSIIQHTEIPYDEGKATQILEIAQSYIDAIKNGNLKIVYKSGYSTLSGENQVLKNENGIYVINCSAFVGLILRGIAYENSPFFDDDGSKVNARIDLFSWANPDYENAHIINANELAEYAFQTGCMLNSNDYNLSKKGDILFFSKGEHDYFGNIWHVAIVLEDGAKTCVHALNGKSSAIWTFNVLDEMEKLGSLKFIARPRYNIDFSNSIEIKLRIIEHPVNQIGKTGDIAMFKVVATGDGLTYEWQYSTNGKNWYKSGFAGWNTDTQPVEIKSTRNGHKYRCIVTDRYGNSVTSESAEIIFIE